MEEPTIVLDRTAFVLKKTAKWELEINHNGKNFLRHVAHQNLTLSDALMSVEANIFKNQKKWEDMYSEVLGLSDSAYNVFKVKLLQKKSSSADVHTRDSHAASLTTLIKKTKLFFEIRDDLLKEVHKYLTQCQEIALDFMCSYKNIQACIEIENISNAVKTFHSKKQKTILDHTEYFLIKVSNLNTSIIQMLRTIQTSEFTPTLNQFYSANLSSFRKDLSYIRRLIFPSHFKSILKPNKLVCDLFRALVKEQEHPADRKFVETSISIVFHENSRDFEITIFFTEEPSQNSNGEVLGSTDPKDESQGPSDPEKNRIVTSHFWIQ